MSKGKTAKKKTGDSKKSGYAEKGLEWKRILRIMLGLFFAAAAIFTLISLISYIRTWQSDQSVLFQPDMFNSGTQAGNAGSKIGFLWGNLLIAKLFGLGSFAVPVFLLALSIFCLRLHRVNIIRIFILCLFGAIIFSGITDFIFSFFGKTDFLGGVPGGSYGHFAVSWLTSAIGGMGTGLVLLLLFILWLMLLHRKVALWFDNVICFTTHKAEQAIISAGKAVGRTAENTATEEENSGSDREEEPGGVTSGSEGSAEDTVEEKHPDDGEDFPVVTEDGFTEDGKEDGDWRGYAVEENLNDVIKPLPAIKSPEPQAPADVPLSVVESGNDFMSNLTEDEKARIFDPRLDLPRYERPPLSLLNDYRSLWYEVPLTELEKNKQRIVNALANYKIGVSGITASKGPTVTLYKIRLAEGIKVAQVRSLEEDIAISLGTKGVRVVTLTDAVGIEVPNEHASVVPLKSVLNSPQFKQAGMELPLALGITVTNEPFYLDLGKMPHLLVAGATGMGKSVGLNCIVASLLYSKHPAEIKFVMVDPKKVELSLYSKLEKHFLAKLPDGDEAIITDTKKVICTLKSLCIEMEDRYELMKNADVRQIKEYNNLFLNRKLNPGNGHRYMPYIIVVIDEFADLITTAGREIEEPIARLAQKARAVGIHLVLATQRPTTDIITGTIKANFNARIAFKVNSMVDSKTIIDMPGANRLIGRGDMLVVAPNKDLTRVQCALIDKEVADIVKFIKEQDGYDKPYFLPDYDEDGEDGASGDVDLRKRDKLFEEAAKIIVQYQQGSTSLLQRKLNLGYNRAARLIDQLEAAGIVGPFEGSKARNVLISDFDTLDHRLNALDNQPIL